MAVLIPSKSGCSFETRGEERLAERLEQKLDDDHLVQYNEPVGSNQSHLRFLPAQNMPGGAKMVDMVDRVIRAAECSHVPGGQYQAQAVMIDEGHDFASGWLKLVTQMVNPATDSLLVLYDDAQGIYERARSKQFSFKSVGIRAQGRTTILKINYRNTRQILHTASLVAADLLTADDKDDDGIPLLKPVSCRRDGLASVIIKLPKLRDEVGPTAAPPVSASRMKNFQLPDLQYNTSCKRQENFQNRCSMHLSQQQKHS